MPNLYVEIQGRVVVLVHNGLPYTPEEWGSIVALAARRDLDALRVLVFDEGGSISSIQRAELIEAMGPRMPRAAVLTDSVLSRGVTTAIGWFKPGVRAFRVDDFEKVARYLELTEKERAFAGETAKRLQGLLAGTARQSA